MEVAIEVTSTVDGTGPYDLQYMIRTTTSSRSFRLWMPAAKPSESELVLNWEAAASSQYFDAIGKEKLGLLGTKRFAVTVSFPVKGVQLSIGKPLILMQGEEPIAEVSAPAYIPSR